MQSVEAPERREDVWPERPEEQEDHVRIDPALAADIAGYKLREKRDKRKYILRVLAVYLLVVAVVVLAVMLCDQGEELRIAQARLAELERGAEEQTARIQDLRERLEKAETDGAFWLEHGAVIVPGEDVYHRVSCTKVKDGTEVLAISIEMASYQGYKPCGQCRPPLAAGEDTFFTQMERGK